MRRVDTSWKKDVDWKNRYFKLYSRTNTLNRDNPPPALSYINSKESPYTSMLMRMRSAEQRGSIEGSLISSPSYFTSLLSQQSEFYSSRRNSLVSDVQSDDLGGNETILLNMVRARSMDMREAMDKTLELPRDDVSDDLSSERCVHGLSMRMTERSISRSRVSRMSTRRDMDIPSILAFSTNVPAPVQLEIPAFRKMKDTQREDMPRWSIRRSVCPVCSQKWKDKSSIRIVKNSGLKKNSSLELPSVIAPARLRTSIMLEYIPRPVVVAVDKDAGVVHSGMRNSSASWQLIRARRFRTPKLQMPSPEASAPPSAAPLARKDLDIRVTRFLSDEALKK